MISKDDALKRLEAAHAAEPRKAPFIVFSWDDHMIGAGGVGFYATVEGLLDDIVVASPALYDEQELTPLLREVVDQHAVGELTESLRETVNQVAKGAFRVEWWGTFDDLCSTVDDEFAADLRERFREDYEEETDDVRRVRLRSTPVAPIEQWEVESFREMLHEYGV